MTDQQAHQHQHEHAQDPAQRPGGTGHDHASWEERYRGAEALWSGKVNPPLVDEVTGLAPGRALDVGCGEGGDVLWLAGQGWQATGVDVSGTALAESTRRAEAAGVTDRVRWERHDLGRTFPAGTFDLVTTHYLHSPAELPREQVLRRAAEAVAPGGTLVVVGHATLPPWADAHHDLDLPRPEQEWAMLGLGAGWTLRRAELVPRPVTGPDGQQAEMTDSVVVATRTG